MKYVKGKIVIQKLTENEITLFTVRKDNSIILIIKKDYENVQFHEEYNKTISILKR